MIKHVASEMHRNTRQVLKMYLPGEAKLLEGRRELPLVSEQNVAA